MNVITYALRLRTLAGWTAGTVSAAKAQAAWDELTEHGFTTQPTPSREGWPGELRQHVGDARWGTFATLAAALGPTGILAAGLGDAALLDSVARQVRAARANLRILGIGAAIGLAAAGALTGLYALRSGRFLTRQESP